MTHLLCYFAGVVTAWVILALCRSAADEQGREIQQDMRWFQQVESFEFEPVDESFRMN